MYQQDPKALQQFNNQVSIKFQLYNGLFTALPFHRIENTGVLLSLLLSECEEGFAGKLSPDQIIERFFERQLSAKSEDEKIDMLFRFTQYAERQVVLFDAIEDAAFSYVQDVVGAGTLNHLLAEVQTSGRGEALQEKLQDFCVQLVLTAHPTQFYTGSVLGIIHDTRQAVATNDVLNINTYLQQLGKTPFLKRQKPTPYDEAVSLMWFLENVFYNAAGDIVSQLTSKYPKLLTQKNPIIKMGFWPGGDRDGNPFVTASTTLRVAAALRSLIIRCYYNDVRNMRRRLTFIGVEPLVIALEKKLYDNIFVPENRTSISKEIILDILLQMKLVLERDHNSLFVHHVNSLINKVHVFGLHFAMLDIRQESDVHTEALNAIAEKENALPKKYAGLSDAEKMNVLCNIRSSVTTHLYEGVIKDCIQTMAAVKRIQTNNGEEGCNRYIISQCRTALNVLEVYGLFLLSGWKANDLPIDIVPLFETVYDLRNARSVMKALYAHEAYAAHLAKRGNKQTIMLGFSDGTKDGGYLMANWSIYKAKEELSMLSKEYDIDVVFFDGRGGPPARGGGKTHRFYASMGKNIANKEIQVTVQGQTISSSFGTVESAKYNIEQLMSAGISNSLFSKLQTTLQEEDETLLQELSAVSLQKYIGLKEHPQFMQYLNDISPLQYYSETNIGSRPAKRGKGELTLKDLRAIPYVGAWSQLKQNVTGFYGVGTALKMLEDKNGFGELKALYQRSLFVKTLFDNCEMSMKKCYFPLTEHFKNDPLYGPIWNLIYEEFELTKSFILKLSGAAELMAGYPVDKLSIEMRERIVLPLSTIQQYAIGKIRELPEDEQEKKALYRKLVIRSSFGIINAARNSV